MNEPRAWIVPVAQIRHLRFQFPEDILDRSDLTVDAEYGVSKDDHDNVLVNAWISSKDSEYRRFIGQYIFPCDVEDLRAVGQRLMLQMSQDADMYEAIDEYLEVISDE